MTVEALKQILEKAPSDMEIVGEKCFEKHHGMKLVHAGIGQDEKFVLFFKDFDGNKSEQISKLLI